MFLSLHTHELIFASLSLEGETGIKPGEPCSLTKFSFFERLPPKAHDAHQSLAAPSVLLFKCMTYELFDEGRQLMLRKFTLKKTTMPPIP